MSGLITTVVDDTGATVAVATCATDRRTGLTLGELARFVDSARKLGLGDDTHMTATTGIRRGQLTDLRTRYTP